MPYSIRHSSMMMKFGLAGGDPAYIAPEIYIAHYSAMYRFIAL